MSPKWAYLNGNFLTKARKKRLKKIIIGPSQSDDNCIYSYCDQSDLLSEFDGSTFYQFIYHEREEHT